MNEVLEFLNEKIREEHGNRVSIDSMLSDAKLDSFGLTVVFFSMDEKYGCYNNEWFMSHTAEQWKNMTIRYIVERAVNESTRL